MSTVNNNTISSFIGGFGGGLRPNRFIIVADNGFPAIGALKNEDNQFTFHVRSASLPSSDLSVIPVGYRGREFKIPGNRSYSSWQISIIDDIDTGNGKNLWKKFHKWSNLISGHTTNLKSGDNYDFTDLMRDWTVKQLDLNGKCEKQVTLVKCWPSEVGPVNLMLDDNENLSTFSVTLEYQYFVREKCTD
jgi:hypothetical protein